MSNTNYLHILCSTDDNFAQHCAVMLCSLFENNSEHMFCIHVLENHLSDDNKCKITNVAQSRSQHIVFHTVPEHLVDELHVHADCVVSDAAYWRLYVASIIDDKDISRILYLDCDIVVNDDISSLFNIDMTEYSVAAVRDIYNPIREDHRQSLSLSYRDSYFNSGVMLINLDNWRRDGIEQKLIACAKRLNSRIYPDQDPLNVVFRNQWLELAPYWNRFSLVKYKDVYFRNKADELQYIYQPKIIHYASPTSRPWMKMCFVKFQKEYDKYLKLTPWAGTKKVEVERFARYKSIFMVNYSNFIFRSPLLIRIVLTSMSDVLLVFYHLLRHFSLRYFSPHR